MDELRIEYLSPDELTPYENNARKHAPDDIEGIKKSILDVGFLDPIGIWGEQNIIVEGHGRQIAAKELMLEKVPVIRLDRLTDAQRKEYAIRHNYTSDQSEFDFVALEEELARLNIDGIDMSDIKIDFNEIPPIPDDLDGEDYNSQSRIGVKLIFENYDAYAEHEQEIKEFADSIGADYSVVKA